MMPILPLPKIVCSGANHSITLQKKSKKWHHLNSCSERKAKKLDRKRKRNEAAQKRSEKLLVWFGQCCSE